MCYDPIRATVLKPVVFHMNPFCSSEASTKKVRLWGWIRTIDGQIDDSARPLVLVYAVGADRFDEPDGQAACGLNRHPKAVTEMALPALYAGQPWYVRHREPVSFQPVKFCKSLCAIDPIP